VIPANSSNKAEATKFLTAFVDGQGQDTIAKDFGYGPVSVEALSQIDPNLLQELPSYTPNAKLGVPFNGEWWAKNEASVQEKWNRWLLEK
jgi:spermidine/putrescine-binding protein